MCRGRGYMGIYLPLNFTLSLKLLFKKVFFLKASCFDSRESWIFIPALAEKKRCDFMQAIPPSVSHFSCLLKGGYVYVSRAQVVFQSSLLHGRYQNLSLEGLNQQTNNWAR